MTNRGDLLSTKHDAFYRPLLDHKFVLGYWPNFAIVLGSGATLYGSIRNDRIDLSTALTSELLA